VDDDVATAQSYNELGIKRGSIFDNVAILGDTHNFSLCSEA
jgi:hypothetical protein